jgi:hypothetical protein
MNLSQSHGRRCVALLFGAAAVAGAVAVLFMAGMRQVDASTQLPEIAETRRSHADAASAFQSALAGLCGTADPERAPSPTTRR